MATYRVAIEADVARVVRRLPGHVRQRVRLAVTALGAEPHPPRSRPLRDHPNYHRLRLDGWRIIYLVDDQARLVIVIAVRRKTGPETYAAIP